MKPGRLAPGLGIVSGFAFAVVEDFAEGEAGVAVVFEMLRQRDDIGHVGPHEVLVVEDARRVGARAAEHAAARGIAHGDLAIGPLKQHAL